MKAQTEVDEPWSEMQYLASDAVNTMQLVRDRLLEKDDSDTQVACAAMEALSQVMRYVFELDADRVFEHEIEEDLIDFCDYVLGVNKEGD